MSVLKRNHTQQAQFEIMVEFMIKHPDLAKGILKIPDAKAKCKHLWEKLSLDLNAVCTPTRDVNGWKKVWADLKNNIKNKCRRNQMSISGTGGGPSKYCSLTPLEEKVVELLSINDAVNGMDGTCSFGATVSTTTLNKTSNVDQSKIHDEVHYELHSDLELPKEGNNSNEYVPSKQSRRDKSLGKECLLRKQVENQMSYHENSMKLLQEVCKNQENNSKILSEINNNIAGVQKYVKRNYELQERKYKLEKEKFEYKKKSEIEKSKRKMENLKIKKRILELELEKRHME